MAKRVSARAGRFTHVSLSMNIGGLPSAAECNPGGSYICTTGTQGCDAGLTCVGTSSSQDCLGGSAVFDPLIESRILIERSELKALQGELQRVLNKFTGRRGGR
jgi:hypothetical protein